MEESKEAQRSLEELIIQELSPPRQAVLADESASRASSINRQIYGILPPGSRTPQTTASWTSHGADSDASFNSAVQQEEAKLRWDADEELQRLSRTLLRMQKWSLVAGLAIINGSLIYAAIKFWQVYYLFIVLLSSNTTLQAFMVLCIVGVCVWNKVFCALRKRKETVPEEPERMVLLLPCYNETPEELSKSLDSLIDQEGIEQHPRLILIVVDGNVRGPGMDKTTQRYLLEDILEPGPCRVFQNGYRARDGLFMPVKVQTGTYRGLPYVLVGKKYNQGKRDSLCFARSFLYHYQQQQQRRPTSSFEATSASTSAGAGGVVTMFHNDLFAHLGAALVRRGLATVDYLVGMDADTVFDRHCVWEMLREMRTNPRLVGVCGHVCVDFAARPFGLWSLYQSVEYSQTQGLRRMFQSRVTGKVNCLPGCCQLIRIDEATFGDEVLRRRFGYCPKPNDVMTRHIMGNYSEDSIHASIIFSLFPKKQTAQALRAKAFTIVPQTWGVFLSQRKRWALGSISNEFVMIFRPGIILIERLQSVVAVLTWAITPFIVAALGEMIMLFVKHGKEVIRNPVFLALFSLLWVRYLYSFCIGFWLPRNNIERAQYFVGFFIHFFTSPFMNIIILVYSLANSDDFKWGKTREVVQEGGEGNTDAQGGRGTH
ncbi:chitin synthase [Cordyceps fumosorosea ARSEF 2679]|uniref:chitin synthase n=1 Tax=Cordyceps fumosorosea (strain ARSEF 2679) TaxID=1081104 RepID=A0A162K5T2_CORFA|nr:chitin synthase [Cordyceps fumosorosea ARSEF 2679]OAA53718.1 chitin synthase [Cordyceps fumosorosea ARSEF 2679]